MQRRLFDLRYSADLLTNEASTVVGAKERVDKWKAEIEALHQEMEGLRDKYPQLVQHLERYWTFPPPRAARRRQCRRRRLDGAAAPMPAAREPFFNSVYDAAQFADGADAHYTMIDYKPGEARDLPVMPHGSVTADGPPEPRHFLSVLSKGDSTFHHGSGRADLADRIFTDGAPLAARVIVNRVWAWHFGKGLAATTSDFGTQGEKPTHPELLDDLAARFIAHGWSLKWLNREIVLSAAYRQSSHPRADGEAADSTNNLLWRMNPRRMDIESFRDSLLRAAGKLSEEMHGPSEEADSLTNFRRTVYARVSRARVNGLLREYDFPDPIQTASGRDLTVTSLQQLFLMNSPWVHNLSNALAESVANEPDAAAKDPRPLSQGAFARRPARAIPISAPCRSSRYAQILLSTNEEIFWP